MKKVGEGFHPLELQLGIVLKQHKPFGRLTASFSFITSIAPPTGGWAASVLLRHGMGISQRCNISSLVWSSLSSIARDWDYDYGELMV